jgi:sec-independent protein translocase protein TatA
VYPLAVFGLGPGEIILLVLVILIVFGAGRLPQIGGSLGKGLKNFRKGLKGKEEEKDQDKPKK